MRMRHLRMIYVFASTGWLVYVLFTLLRVPAADRNPNPAAFAYCLLLVGVLPSVVGYWLIFKAVPWIGRTVRR
jgi:drug/metabolite transporter (DMT)-like permease